MKKILKNRAAALVMAVILCASLVIPMSGCAEKKRDTITVNVSYGSYTDAALIIAEKKGFFEKNMPNYTIEYAHVASSPDIRDAMISKQIDVSGMSIFSYITAYEEGMPISLISFNGGAPVYMYSANDEIKDVSDIKSEHRISINNKATVIHFAFLAYCKENFGDAMIYDSNLTTIAAADAIAALQTNDDFDAALFNFPGCVKAENIDGVSKIADFTSYIMDYNVGSALFTRDEFYDQYPDVIEAVKKAHQEGTEFIKNNRDEAAEILAEAYGVDKERLLEVFDTMLPALEITGYDKIASLMYEIGILDHEPGKFEDLRNYDDIPK